jgi:hypothetical protein
MNPMLKPSKTSSVQKQLQNFVPRPYNQVSVQAYHGPMTAEAIEAHLLGKDSYRRTRYVILEGKRACAIASVSHESDTPLFSPINSVEVLALPDTCLLVEDETVDSGNPTALAMKAVALGLGPQVTLVVRGLYGHVNFIHQPAPIKIRLVEVTPPHPAKLLNLAREVLAYVDDLPPIHLVSENIDVLSLAGLAAGAEALLIPCRASGLNFEVPTYYLDERPARHNWTMIACERSRQFHHHFYGDEAPRVEMCPRRLMSDEGGLALVKCCLLEDGIEVKDNRAVVPWGASRAQVEAALRALVAYHLKDEG